MKLEKLWRKVDNCPFCKNNKLQHIHGGGLTKNPKAMFLFINPTYNNMSTAPDYTGPRTPFLGTKAVWKVFANSGILPKQVIEKTQIWNKDTINYILSEMKKHKTYFTNVSKCAKPHADAPSKEEVEYSKKLLFEEINLVNPKKIITMGLLPFKTLIGESIKLKEHLKKPSSFETIIKGKKYEVLPCYFPVGRGNPREATEMLKYYKKHKLR